MNNNIKPNGQNKNKDINKKKKLRTRIRITVIEEIRIQEWIIIITILAIKSNTSKWRKSESFNPVKDNEIWER